MNGSVTVLVIIGAIAFAVIACVTAAWTASRCLEKRSPHQPKHRT